MELNLQTKQDNTIPFYKHLTRRELEDIAANSNMVKFDRREVVFRQNTRTSHIMFVKTGLVKIYKEGRNNKYIILKLAVPGEYIGFMSIYGGDLHHYSAAAIEPTEVVFVDNTVFNNILKTNGDFAMKIIGMLSASSLFIFDRLMS